MDEQQIPKELVGLSGIEGISIIDGVHFCGGIRDFDNFLEAFYEDIDDKSAEMESAYQSGDIGLLTIKAHALKSLARIIGAKKLSEMSLAFENAGKDNDISYIDDNFDSYMSFYKGYKDIIGKYLKLRKQQRQKEKKLLSNEELREAYEALKEVTADEDAEAVEMVLEELDRYIIPPDAEGTINEIKELLTDYNWEKIGELLGTKGIC